MKPEDLKRWLAVLPPNTAAVEISDDGVKLQFFPVVPTIEPVRPAPEPPAEERGPAPPTPDATMLALMAQNGQA